MSRSPSLMTTTAPVARAMCLGPPSRYRSSDEHWTLAWQGHIQIWIIKPHQSLFTWPCVKFNYKIQLTLSQGCCVYLCRLCPPVPWVMPFQIIRLVSSGVVQYTTYTPVCSSSVPDFLPVPLCSIRRPDLCLSYWSVASSWGLHSALAQEVPSMLS